MSVIELEKYLSAEAKRIESLFCDAHQKETHSFGTLYKPVGQFQIIESILDTQHINGFWSECCENGSQNIPSLLKNSIQASGAETAIFFRADRVPNINQASDFFLLELLGHAEQLLKKLDRTSDQRPYFKTLAKNYPLLDGVTPSCYLELRKSLESVRSKGVPVFVILGLCTLPSDMAARIHSVILHLMQAVWIENAIFLVKKPVLHGVTTHFLHAPSKQVLRAIANDKINEVLREPTREKELNSDMKFRRFLLIPRTLFLRRNSEKEPLTQHDREKSRIAEIVVDAAYPYLPKMYEFLDIFKRLYLDHQKKFQSKQERPDSEIVEEGWIFLRRLVFLEIFKRVAPRAFQCLITDASAPLLLYAEINALTGKSNAESWAIPRFRCVYGDETPREIDSLLMSAGVISDSEALFSSPMALREAMLLITRPEPDRFEETFNEYLANLRSIIEDYQELHDEYLADTLLMDDPKETPDLGPLMNVSKRVKSIESKDILKESQIDALNELVKEVKNICKEERERKTRHNKLRKSAEQRKSAFKALIEKLNEKTKIFLDNLATKEKHLIDSIDVLFSRATKLCGVVELLYQIPDKYAKVNHHNSKPSLSSIRVELWVVAKLACSNIDLMGDAFIMPEMLWRLARLHLLKGEKQRSFKAQRQASLSTRNDLFKEGHPYRRLHEARLMELTDSDNSDAGMVYKEIFERASEADLIDPREAALRGYARTLRRQQSQALSAISAITDFFNEWEPSNIFVGNIWQSSVFISYRSESRILSRKLANEILKRKSGWRVWLDQEEIGGVEDGFEKAMLQGIRNASAIILLISSDYFGSKWCNDEMFLALGRHSCERIKVYWGCLGDTSADGNSGISKSDAPEERVRKYYSRSRSQGSGPPVPESRLDYLLNSCVPLSRDIINPKKPNEETVDKIINNFSTLSGRG